MAKSLFTELKVIGVDEETAAHVQASLSGDIYATKSDLLVMQRLIYDQNEKMVTGFADLKAEISSVRTELKEDIANVRVELKEDIGNVRSELKGDISDVRSELGTMHQQYWITFSGLITTMLTVFVVNWYYHI